MKPSYAPRTAQKLKIQRQSRSSPEKVFELNFMHWEKGYSLNKLKTIGFSEVVVYRDVFQTRREWEAFRDTFMGTLNPGIAIQNNSKGEG